MLPGRRRQAVARRQFKTPAIALVVGVVLCLFLWIAFFAAGLLARLGLRPTSSGAGPLGSLAGE